LPPQNHADFLFFFKIVGIMKQVVLTALCVLLTAFAFGQYSISGTITDITNGEVLINVTVQMEGTEKGTHTNFDGKFSFDNLEAGTYTFIASYIGYKSISKTVTITNENIELNFDFNEISDDLIVCYITVLDNHPLRANKNTPMTYSNMSKEELEANNLGQDVPYLLQMTPSTVVTSDAGAGVGYTGIRIRGTDASRINVTINGIPVNDAESQGVFWVNLPDFASSTQSVQIQRGVGTSTNGAGAFGGTVNMETNKRGNEDFVGFNGTIGSFGTFKSNVSFNKTLGKHFNINGRLSAIQSDGYIDRASSDLASYQVSASYVNNNNSLEFINFHGKEVTYQAWYGIDPETLQTDRTFNPAGTESDPPYENQVDDYQQTYYQLLYKHQADNGVLRGALHYTRGKGFYEEYKAGEEAAYYNLTNYVPDTITETDLVRRRWLDNHFYGATASYTYTPNSDLNLIVGGAINNYIGDHFGETIWAKEAIGNINDVISDVPVRYYEGVGEKLDANIYTKVNYQLTDKLNAFGDVQYRFVSHDITGIDNDKRDVTQNNSFNFLNPKAGFTLQQNDNVNFYFSYAMANREPNRGDFTDAPTTAIPTAERLHDFEFGNRLTYNKFSFNTNVYYMLYDDQLVLTGQINDVGSAIRVNVDNSYRLGLELVGGVDVTKWLEIRANATFSQNKITNFVEYVDDWDNWGSQVTINHGTTDIAFSPNLIAAGEFIFTPFTNDVIDTEIALMSKYVGKQFIDNTNLETSSLDAYFTNDIRLSLGLKQKWAKNIRLTFLTRNVFNELYESNSWLYRYNSGGEISQLQGLYPQAGRHFFLGLDLKF
jgi:iron complex outermembrane receptor protein